MVKTGRAVEGGVNRNRQLRQKIRKWGTKAHGTEMGNQNGQQGGEALRRWKN